MWDVVYYLAVVSGLAVATLVGAFLVRSFLSGAGPRQAVGGLFAPKPQRRLAITEQFNIDARHRVILLRRDNVEHLIMTGGPVDVVIETGIVVPQAGTIAVLQAGTGAPSADTSTPAVAPPAAVASDPPQT